MATGRLRYVYRNWPIERIHPQAFKAAEAAECAGDQGRFWELHERLFADPQKLKPANLVEYAREVGLNTTAFEECLNSGKHAGKVRKDLADGRAAGVTGTPAFFIGPTPATGQTMVRTATVLKGAKSYADFKEAIDALLATSGG